MKPKFLTALFLLAFVGFSLYSCTADTVNDTAQKSTVIPKVSTPVADEGDNTIAEPIIINPK